MHVSIKRDALQTVYNLVTLYTQSRAAFVQWHGVTALWKVLKVSVKLTIYYHILGYIYILTYIIYH